MRPFQASTVIEVWEKGLGQPSVERALVVLSACTDEPPEILPTLSLGERDRRLTAVYRRLFGETLHAFAECPQCAERLEYSISARDLNLTSEIPAGPDDMTLISGDLSLRLRLPNSLDLRAASRCRTVPEARALLARRCVVEGDLRIEQLPDSLVEQISSHLAKAEPQAETLIHLTCAACCHDWQTVLDPEQFLWAKIAALARRLLREVHVLARAYGWCERDILCMTAARRQFYLEMVAS